jgi:hypothetical protein
MVKLRYEYFWPGLNPNDFFITKYFESASITQNDDYDILVCSVFPNRYININPKAKIILFNGEHSSYIVNFIQKTNIYPHILMGFCDIPQQTIKELYVNYTLPTLIYYPLWILYYDNVFSQDYFNKKNEEIMNITREEFDKKRICCLINSHDMNNVRTPIYNFIKLNNGNVDCPGRLLNNMNNKLVGTSSEDKLRFMSNYKFNICSENKYGLGYLTEKLPQCMDSGCIPLYIGCKDTNKINYKIFNINRVVFMDKSDNFDKLKELLDSPDKQYELYKQPIFNDDSFKILKNFMNLTKTILLNKIV